MNFRLTEDAKNVEFLIVLCSICNCICICICISHLKLKLIFYAYAGSPVKHWNLFEAFVNKFQFSNLRFIISFVLTNDPLSSEK